MKYKDEQSDAKKTNERKKFLNVIYFIDSQKTHAFKVSTTLSSFLVTILSLIILWSFLSTGLLIKQYAENKRQSGKIKSLLATIFSYETKYDQIYEKTYPSELNESSTSPLADTVNTLNEKELTSEDSSEKEKEKEIQSLTLSAKKAEIPESPETMPSYHSIKETPSSSEKTQTAGVAPEENKETILKPTTKPTPQVEKSLTVDPPPIELKDMALKSYAKHVEFSFSLTNLESPSLASGYLLAIATFVDNDGNIKEVLAPPGVQFMKPIEPTSLPTNHRFSIRYYKKKTLTFTKPSEFQGWVEKIRILVRDQNGNRREIVYNPTKQS